MKEKSTPSYYAIIPASVRYDNNLPAGAKLLYGEITALSNQKGYCFASNGYFSNLYRCTPQAISKWFKQLEKYGHVKIEYHGNTGIQERRVSIIVDGYQSQLRGVSTGVDGVSTTVEHNNTSIIIQETNSESAPAKNQTIPNGSSLTPPPDSAPPPSPKRSRFVRPEVSEMIEYMEDLFLNESWRPRFINNPDETAAQIHDYYTANGWKVGRNAMKDWKAACRNWLKNNEKYAPKYRPNVSRTSPQQQPQPLVSEETHRRALARTLAALGVTGGGS